MELIFYLLYFRSYNDKTINNTFTAQQTTVSAVRNTAEDTAAGSFYTLRCRQMPNSVTARRIPYSGAYTRSPET